MTNKLFEELADRLYETYENKQPIYKEDFDVSIDNATGYRIQKIVTDKKGTEKNDPLKGYKISLTSRETQNLFQSTTPLYGAFTETSISGGSIKLEDMLSSLIELELVFIVKENLSKEDSFQTILEKTTIAPGLEIPDSRFADWFPKLQLGHVIADSAVAGKVVIGTPVEGLTFEQLGTIKGTLTLNGKQIASGSSSEVLGNPLHSVKWLIDELATNGLILEKGMIISSGTFIMPEILKKGTYEAVFEGIGEVVLNVV
ncbi:2-keto-4-pentenoate hydratase [Sporosarcina sp. G11-34]|uniref:2-keto-4-pentenoate hydratase n=1 Tax=Sporosarcina sp. G11-34 TaxID=2849605 RepID=UPI0022A8D9D0|nr:hypothetical protein [Sporosarcina sp. G11-34]MCZ2257812.1 hypothetical protein [Sporosarcina sp. G11-34]